MRKTRLQAIIAHWSHVAQYYGGAAAKRYRTNLKRAATAASNTANLFDGFDNESRRALQGDIEILRKAAVLLSQLSDEFAAAQTQGDRIQEEARRKREVEEAQKIDTKVSELFGPSPDPEQVYGMAIDLSEFCSTGVNQFAQLKGCDRGLLSGEFRANELKYEAQQKRLASCMEIIATNAIESRYPGRQHNDLRDIRWYHASWNDFLEWRQNRNTMSKRDD